VLRRLRGLLGAVVLGTACWTVLGFIAGAVIRLRLIPGVAFHAGPGSSLGVIGTLTLMGTVIGFVNGLAFGLLMSTAERGRSLDDIRPWRFAGWAAISTAAGLEFIFRSTPLIVGGGAVCGALIGVGLLHLARRAALPRSEESIPSARMP
jgi:hypothetical protein